jgi:hypothetical protein
VLTSPDPGVHPDIRMNYFDDPHDMRVMIATLRKALEVVANWRSTPRDRSVYSFGPTPCRSLRSTPTPPATRRATTSSRTSHSTTPGPCTTRPRPVGLAAWSTSACRSLRCLRSAGLVVRSPASMPDVRERQHQARLAS